MTTTSFARVHSQSEVDADGGEDERDEPAVDLGRILVDEMLVLDDLQQRDEHAAGRALEYDLSGHQRQQYRAGGWRGLRFGSQLDGPRHDSPVPA